MLEWMGFRTRVQLPPGPLKNIPGFLVVRVPGYFFVPKYAREAASGRFSVLEYNK